MAKEISIRSVNETLGEILEAIEEKGGFHFSYNSNLLSKDSVLSLSAHGKTIGEVLDLILEKDLEYVETGNYVVLRRKREGLAFVFQDINHRRNLYLVRGYVHDPKTGQKVANASVYEKHLLISDLSDEQGSFKIKIPDKHKTVSLTASKIFYADTTMTIFLEAATVTANKKGQGENDGRFESEKDNNNVERTALGRFFLSSRQRIQSLNLRGFITESPVQVSLTPGLSTHGALSAQVVNKFSTNLLGGYTAGVDGIEMAGLFNINKKNVQYVQAAGLFSTVGGNVKGVQLAGLFNIVLNSARGLQAAGLYNRVEADMSGVQLSGVYNRTEGVMQGFQVSGLLNRAQHLKGVQLGLINIVERSSGYSIGLLNIVKENGYLKLHLSANETFPLNLALKTGTPKFYAILQAAAKPGTKKLYAYGLGFGKQIYCKPKLSVHPELSFLSVYQGSNDFNNYLGKLNVNLSYSLGNFFHVSAGPTLNIFHSKQDAAIDGYGFIPTDRKHHFRIGKGGLIGWLGWNIGISLF